MNINDRLLATIATIATHGSRICCEIAWEGAGRKYMKINESDTYGHLANLINTGTSEISEKH